MVGERPGDVDKDRFVAAWAHLYRLLTTHGVA